MIITVPMFAAGGAISRFVLRSTETRWQIAAVAGLAIALEIVTCVRRNHRASLFRGAANAAAAAMMMATVKFYLEPDARKADSAAMRQAAKAVEYKIASET